eukprot:CFRG0835T1
MSAKAVSEIDGKNIIFKHLADYGSTSHGEFKAARVTPDTDFDALEKEQPWLLTTPLVAKPDQLIKRRGKLGLVKVKCDYPTASSWIKEKMVNDFSIGQTTGKLKNFIIEPFCAHNQEDEYYVSIYCQKTYNTVLFYHEGGVDVGDVDAKAEAVNVDITGSISEEQVQQLISKTPKDRHALLANFVSSLYKLFVDLNFTYMEINPIVVVDNQVHILDLAAKIDETAGYEVGSKWGELTFPPPFGRDSFPEEAYIALLDSKSGASLKLTVLNPEGRVWTMVAGGGASVVYADTVCDLGFTEELANYGEYSGAPSENQTYEYAKTLLGLMCRHPAKNGEPKVLIVGGGIANFTNVATTFKGLIKALREFDERLKSVNARVYVRRAGPNYQEGLRMMRELDAELSVPIEVYGPETHMTAIVGMALGQNESDPTAAFNDPDMGRSLISTDDSGDVSTSAERKASHRASSGNIKVTMANTTGNDLKEIASKDVLFTKDTRAIVYGMQPRAVQGMLDFDNMCNREKPSVAAIIYPFGGFHMQKFYWGTKEMLIPVYPNIGSALEKFPEVDVMVNFASFRSAYDSTIEAMEFPKIKVIAIIAEGIPEKRTRKLNMIAREKNITIIGPATVGGIKPGCFRIGNTGGMMDNIISSKLYRAGSVAYVSRSGGMSNELNNIISRNANGVFEGIAIGGDRYPGSSFMDHIIRYQNQDGCKMIVLLGEVGGVEEYELVDAINNGTITKPVVAWCIGTCGTKFKTDVQFGHAGASANGDMETSVAKNKALKDSGAFVPSSFDDLGKTINKVYTSLVKDGTIVLGIEPPRPQIPIDYSWAQELGLIRKPTSFVSSITDERGEELKYCGMPISEVLNSDMGVGGVVSLLWFKKRLPPYACKFIEMCLMVTADHGPAVSGAHNTIVAARAGKDLVSSLASGLLTIGDRFGGALDGAARQFSMAFDKNMTPREFVNHMRDQKQLIMGIGHRVKSLNNPDMRVEIIKNYCLKHFKSTPLLNFALQVEQVTTSKKPNLILNVDGMIGIAFVDLMRNSGEFSREEADEYVNIGALNGLFVFGRTLGFIGHYLDQKRLKQGLYRHPWDDISYLMSEFSHEQ